MRAEEHAEKGGEHNDSPPCSYLLNDFNENDGERVERQRLDQHETQNEREPDRGRRSRIPRHTLSRAADSVALAERAKTRSNGHGEPGRDRHPYVASACRPAARTLGEHRKRAEHQRDRKKNQFRLQLSYSLIKFVFRRWLRSSPGGGRPHAENGTKPDENSARECSRPGLMFLSYRSCHVHHCQQHKDISLQQRHKNVQPHENRRPHQISKAQKYQGHLLARVHIRK